MYVKSNIIFTSRGCNNNCPFCIVPKNEGKLKELPVCVGNIIQDNNFLQCSRQHKDKVFQMLRTQKDIEFLGGIEAELIDDHFINNLTSIKLRRIYVACDSESRIAGFKKGMKKLRDAGISRERISCYCLSYGKDMEKDEERARMIWNEGAIPFVQLYQGPSDTKTEYSREWKEFQRRWSRPAIIRSRMKNEML